MDNRPFPELRRIIREFQDDRIWVHAELVGPGYEPKAPNHNGVNAWVPGYHNKLYNLTDAAIRACAPSTEWVVVTNGDNNYDPHFLDYVMAAELDVDGIAFNFYSRYQRPTVSPCERFAAGPGLPMCKQNGFRFCQTDLAANAYRRDRLLAEDRRFGVVDPGGHSWGANDGMLSQHLLLGGWKLQNVERCLVDHGPSPQQCALLSGVWDDSQMWSEAGYGGDCLDTESASKLVASDPANLEIINVSVSHDPQSFDFYELEGEPLSLACIRSRDRSTWQQAQVFGRVCCAPVDLDELPDNLPSHPWDDWSGPIEPEAPHDEL